MEFILDGHFLEASNIAMILTLSALEIILGIDNLVILAILIDPLPHEQKKSARRFAVGLALLTRLGLLFSIAWVIGLTKPLFSLPFVGTADNIISIKDLFFILGGSFLLYKAYSSYIEILHGAESEINIKPKKINFWFIVVQAALIDIIFSLDSVITAVGVTEHIGQIVVAMVLTVIAMLFFVGIISNLIEKYPSLKVLAISFIALIGFLLIGSAIGFEINKSYLYAMMGFATIVECLNIFIGSRKEKSVE